MTMSGGFMAMDDDDDSGGDDPCTLTNLLQTFAVTNITQTANGISITFQSCQFFQYLIFTAGQLSSNTVWLPQVYVWGSPGHSSTTWTDTSTTNNDGSAVTQRFYRVQRLLGSPIGPGGFHSLAVLTNGSSWAWGGDDQNQLGDGDVESTNVFSPEEVSSNGCNPESISNARVVAGGFDYGVAADASGVVWSWGDGGYGALGNGGNTNVLTPSPIYGVSNVVSLAAGQEHTLALRADGTVWAFGNNANGSDDTGNGQLGAGYLGGAPSTNSPVQSLVPTGTVIVAVAAGDSFSLALDTTGLIWGWGANEDGELTTNVSVGRDASTNLPTLVAGISNVIAIAAGDAHSIALTSDKRVWTWGADLYGQLGWSANQYNPNPTPTPVPGLSNVVAIAAGYEFSLSVTSNGLVYAWGDNSYGELATNGPSQLTNATMVAGISNAVLVSAHPDGSHSLALTANQGANQYWAWGEDDSGQVGNGTNVDAVYTPYGPLPFTYYNACAECIQLGTNGTFTAYATGTLFLIFNDDNYADNSGSYTATVYGVASNLVIPANSNVGVLFGPVVAGSNYTYSATGICHHCTDPPDQCPSNASGYDPDTDALWTCPSDSSQFTCPYPFQCYSLVAKIE